MSLIYFSVPSNSIHQLLSSIKPNAMTEQNMEVY